MEHIMEKLSIFLSHSHKDIQIVRKIRDLFELLNCEPLMFYLKCLDDDNGTLEELIIKEIKARHIFIYCKSHNSENSKWVQEELKIIKNSARKRIYTIDIDNGFEDSIVEILQKVSRLIIKNTIILFHADEDKSKADILKSNLINSGYKVNCINTESSVIPSMKELEFWEFPKFKQSFDLYFEKHLIPLFEKTCPNSIFIPFITSNLLNGDWNSYAQGKIMAWFDKHPEYDTLFINDTWSMEQIMTHLHNLSIQE